MAVTIVETRAITGGVDTHADTHVAAALDPVGGLLGVREFPVSAAGYAGLLGWLGGFGTVCLVGIDMECFSGGVRGPGLSARLHGVTGRVVLGWLSSLLGPRLAQPCPVSARPGGAHDRRCPLPAPVHRLPRRQGLHRPRPLLPGLASLTACPGGCQMPARSPAAGP